MVKNRPNFEILTALECAYSNYQMAEISCLGTKGGGGDMCIIQESLCIRRVCSDIPRVCPGIRWATLVVYS
jgi:hypothetical protein